MDYIEYIAECIANLRATKGVSAREMSLQLGQSSSYINTIENRKSTPSLESLLNICDYFEIDLLDFLDNKKTEPALINELLEEIQGLDSDTVQMLLTLVKKLKKNKRQG